jgi:hypothetical protein
MEYARERRIFQRGDCSADGEQRTEIGDQVQGDLSRALLYALLSDLRSLISPTSIKRGDGRAYQASEGIKSMIGTKRKFVKLRLENSSRESYIFQEMGTTKEQPFAQNQSLFEASKPRSVRIRAFDRTILITFPAAGVILFHLNATEILGLPQPRISSSQIVGAVLGLVFAAILLVVGCVTAWKVRREKKLMRNGELVVAVVTHQRLVEVRSGRGGKKKSSRVRYRFKDPSGQLYQGTGRTTPVGSAST